MSAMILASLALNILVLVPVTFGIARGAAWAERAYGPANPARGILLSVYLAILGGSVVLLLLPEPRAVATLLALQIAYKVTTPLSVGRVRNPAVASNLAIAAFHAVTLALIISMN